MLARRYAAFPLIALAPLTGGVFDSSSVGAGAWGTTNTAATCAAAIVRGFDQTERVGQLLMIGVPVDDTRGAGSAIAAYKVGSIFLAGRSYRSVSSIRASTDAIVSTTKRWTGISGFVAVDQEGGLVQSLRGPGFTRIDSAQAQGALPVTTLRSRTASWSSQLRSAGITLDLAPVADTLSVSPASANPPIGAFHRSYGTDPAAVSRSISAVVGAMTAQHVGATLKHFPGLGRVRYNPDTSTRAIDRVASASDPNLAPFAAGIRAGARAVMMSSARYPALDPTQPALWSPRIVTGLLQQQLGFRGLVVTDDIGAATALSGVPLGQRAIRFVDAGGQLVLSVRTSDAGPLSRALVSHAIADPAFRRRVDAAAIRVVQAKIDAGLVRCSG